MHVTYLWIGGCGSSGREGVTSWDLFQDNLSRKHTDEILVWREIVKLTDERLHIHQAAKGMVQLKSL